MNDQQPRPMTVQASGLSVVAFVAISVAVGLLVAGTASSHTPMLVWGAVTGVVAVNLVSVVALRGMIDAAVARSVDRTAVQVGSAIAAALADEDRPAGTGVGRIYS